MNEPTATAATQPLVGARFSQNYLKHHALLKDSLRARRRLFSLFKRLRDNSTNYVTPLEEQTGVKVPSDYGGYDWEAFFERGQLRDVLDSVTVFWQLFQRRRVNEHDWIGGTRQIFSEEGLNYSIDDKGGVHLLVDQEFQRERSATLAGLGSSRFVQALTSFEASHAALDCNPPQTREGVRHIFDAVENVFKVMMEGKATRLGDTEIEKQLGPKVRAKYSGPDLNYANLMLGSFRQWTNASHQYRHANGEEQATLPPLELAVLAISTGAGFLRWLLEIDGGEQT